MNFKVFLLIFDISIFIKKYPPIRYIHKMQVSIPIFPTLHDHMMPYDTPMVTHGKSHVVHLKYMAHIEPCVLHDAINIIKKNKGK